MLSAGENDIQSGSPRPSVSTASEGRPEQEHKEPVILEAEPVSDPMNSYCGADGRVCTDTYGDPDISQYQICAQGEDSLTPGNKQLGFLGIEARPDFFRDFKKRTGVFRDGWQDVYRGVCRSQELIDYPTGKKGEDGKEITEKGPMFYTFQDYIGPHGKSALFYQGTTQDYSKPATVTMKAGHMRLLAELLELSPGDFACTMPGGCPGEKSSAPGGMDLRILEHSGKYTFVNSLKTLEYAKTKLEGMDLDKMRKAGPFKDTLASMSDESFAELKEKREALLAYIKKAMKLAPETLHQKQTEAMESDQQSRAWQKKFTEDNAEWQKTFSQTTLDFQKSAQLENRIGQILFIGVFLYMHFSGKKFQKEQTDRMLEQQQEGKTLEYENWDRYIEELLKEDPNYTVKGREGESLKFWRMTQIESGYRHLAIDAGTGEGKDMMVKQMMIDKIKLREEVRSGRFRGVIEQEVMKMYENQHGFGWETEFAKHGQQYVDMLFKQRLPIPLEYLEAPTLKIDATRFHMDTKYRGDVERQVANLFETNMVLDEKGKPAKGTDGKPIYKHVILYIEEGDILFLQGSTEGSPKGRAVDLVLSQLTHPAVREYTLIVTTTSRGEELIRTVPDVQRRFQWPKLRTYTLQDVIDSYVDSYDHRQYENKGRVTLPKESIEAAAKLAEKYYRHQRGVAMPRYDAFLQVLNKARAIASEEFSSKQSNIIRDAISKGLDPDQIRLIITKEHVVKAIGELCIESPELTTVDRILSLDANEVTMEAEKGEFVSPDSEAPREREISEEAKARRAAEAELALHPETRAEIERSAERAAGAVTRGAQELLEHPLTSHRIRFMRKTGELDVFADRLIADWDATCEADKGDTFVRNSMSEAAALGNPQAAFVSDGIPFKFASEAIKDFRKWFVEAIADARTVSEAKAADQPVPAHPLEEGIKGKYPDYNKMTETQQRLLCREFARVQSSIALKGIHFPRGIDAISFKAFADRTMKPKGRMIKDRDRDDPRADRDAKTRDMMKRMGR